MLRRLTVRNLAIVEDLEIERVIKKQEEAGLQSITDGEFRRSWWHFDFLSHLSGCEMYATEGIQFAGTVAVNGITDAIDKCSQLCAVIVGNHGTSRLSLQLAGHTTEATQNRADEAVLRASAALGRPGY